MIKSTDTTNNNLPQYYKRYSKVAAANGNFKEAYDTLLKSWNLQYKNTYQLMDKKIVELEKKYDYSEMKRIAEQERNHKIILIIVFSVILIFITIISYFCYQKQGISIKRIVNFK